MEESDDYYFRDTEEVAGSSSVLVASCQITRCHTAKDIDLHNHCYECLKPHSRQLCLQVKSSSNIELYRIYIHVLLYNCVI